MSTALRLWCLSAAAAVLALGVLVPGSGANHATVELLSVGSTGGNSGISAHFNHASADGTRLLFQTEERLEPIDSDTQLDIYERFGSTTRLISYGSAGGNGAFYVAFRGASADGTRAFFVTDERLEPGDIDLSFDVYERFGSTTTRISTGSTDGNGPASFFAGASADGTRVFFTTVQRLEPGDTDGTIDVYERSGSTTTLISTGPSGGNGTFDATFAGASADGSRVFFVTSEHLEAADTDSAQDVYQRFGSTTTRISTGSSGGNGGGTASFRGASADGTRVFFVTSDHLEPGESDTVPDIFERYGSTTTRISTGPSGGNAHITAQFQGTSTDGTRVFMRTKEQLEPGDTDTLFDIYERHNSTTTRISTGPSGGNGPFEVSYGNAFANGTRVFFATDEQLEPGDTDTSRDIYERHNSTTTRISTGPSGGNESSPNNTDFFGASTDGTRVFLKTVDRLLAADTDSGYDIYVAALASTAGYPRPIGASPIQVSLVPAYDECTSPNAGHPGPFTGEACNPPNLSSDHLTVGTPDANGAPAKSNGVVRINVIEGTPGGADDSDASLEVRLTDVRNQGSLTDHTGELRMTTELRITDKTTGSAGTAPGTVVDLPLDVTVPCAATADTTIGGLCSITTTLDSLLGANAVPEGKRAIYDIVGGVDVFDGGPDGNADTPAGDTLFVTDGFFVP